MEGSNQNKNCSVNNELKKFKQKLDDLEIIRNEYLNLKEELTLNEV